MRGKRNGLPLAAALLLIAPVADAKIKSAEEMKAGKAYLLVQVDLVEVKILGTSHVTTGILFAPYDPATRQVRPGTMALKDPVVKDAKRRLYLIEIDPGTWVIAGTGASGASLGSADTSFSLGSYHFEAKAGELVDLGVFEPKREESDNPDTRMNAVKLLGGPLFGGRVEPVPNRLDIRPRGESDVAVPEWLATKPLVHPAFVYGGTFGNSVGGLVNRIDGKQGRGRAAGEVVYLSKPGQPKVEPAAASAPEASAPETPSVEAPATPSSLP
jgi:hypothetical protein